MTERSLDMLIDEVVLGLASDADCARLERMAAADPALAARLERARQRFAPLDDTATPLPVPEGFWDRLSDRLDTAQIPPAPAEVVDLGEMRARLARWRGAAFGAVAASLLMACIAGWSLMVPPAPLVVTVLLDADGDAVALVESARDNTTRITLLEQPEVPSGRVMQVWTKPDDAGPPVSLGLLADGRSETLTIRGLTAPASQQLYEITLEPAGGSPTNLPTGPILGVGRANDPVI
ncbi:anti-sigma factor [Mangrovicoccus algicola]|uniref:Anti-sigma factor n=1 Tax=Mangrovicoccus algicola TaxID=2771008 RepID=A0A8J6YQ39_9RHOB|nr:anti-sigma factor [Mangrovicoccus algicola]MBE3637443.1 anti-sigma factor [Mangrovicoccus algicola]